MINTSKKKRKGIYMWSRKELKEAAKRRVGMNRWKAVLAALAFVLLCGGGGAFGSVSGVAHGVLDSDPTEKREEEAYYQDPEFNEFYDGVIEDGVVVFLIVVFIIVAVVFLVLFLVVLPMKILVFHPLEVGISRFFIKNMKEQAQIKELCFAFDHGYKNCVKATFFQKLYIFLWTLLLVVPGIVKSYEYQMVPYILGENPEMRTEEVLALSKDMMYGNKWKAFILDLSFFGWYILNGLTLGILGIFYLNPYVSQTNAALYQVLKEQYLQKASDF